MRALSRSLHNGYQIKYGSEFLDSVQFHAQSAAQKLLHLKMDEWPAGKLPVAMAPTPPSGQDKPPPTHTGAVNINKADAAILDSLPGIGPARAAAIIADRKANGPYTSCTQLQRIKGIGPKTVAGLAPRCIIEDPKETP